MNSTAVKPSPSRKFFSMTRREQLTGFVFVAPWVIGFLAFTMLPLFFSLYTSFTDYDITSKMDFIGFKNYMTMFTSDQLYLKSLYNTIFYVLISVPLNTLGAVLLAVLMNQKIPGLRLYRTIFYLPHVLSGVAIYLLWMELLNPSTGLINVMLHWIGIKGPAWLYDPNWTKPALILMGFWGLGGGMILYLNALQSVPEQLYEAAEMDGASLFRRFFHITLPMITPIIFFETVTGIIGAFQVFQSAYVMTDHGSGGPENSLLFYNLHLWHQAFVSYKVGYANAMAWMLFVFVMVLTLINIKLSKHWVHYEGGDQ